MKKSKFFLIFALSLLGTGLAFAQARPVANITDIQSGRDKTIKITWEFPKKTDPKIEGIKIYRGSRPYTSSEEIDGDLPIAELDAGQRSYNDIPEANGSYFYAVIAVTQKGLYKIVIPGMNATTSGARPKIAAPAQQEAPKEKGAQKVDPSKLTESQKELYYADSRMRNAPLPNPGVLLGFDAKKTKMSGQAQASAKELGSKKDRTPVPIKAPYFFEEDMFSPDGGDEYILFETLRAGLAPKKYAKSVELLQDFLSVHRNEETTNRAQFYLGQSYYFCKDYKNAIRYFLGVQEAFPELSKQWIDSSLDLLVIE